MLSSFPSPKLQHFLPPKQWQLLLIYFKNKFPIYIEKNLKGKSLISKMPCFIIKGNTPQAAINAFLNNNSSISKGRKGQTCWCTPVVSVAWRLEDGRFSVQGQPWVCSTLETSLRYIKFFLKK